MTLRIAIGFGSATIAANIPPNTPTITSVAGSTTVALSGSTFSDPDSGTHAASRWQVATAADTAYSSPVVDSGETATYLLSYNAPGLSAETAYIAQVAYKDSGGGWSEWSTNTSFTTTAVPTTDYENIAVAVTRLAAGTGTGLCSTGIPLPAGLFFLGDEAKVRVVIGGVEQAIYVEALPGIHESDNSVRTILVQFNISCNYGSPLTGTVEVGTGVTRSTTDISKTTPIAIPAIVCLPSTTAYLLRCDIVPPTISLAASPSTPTFIPAYEAKFTLWAERHWAQAYPICQSTPSDGPPYWEGYRQYDRSQIWFIWWVRTADITYFYRAIRQANAYIQNLVGRTSNNMWAPYFAPIEGPLNFYLLTGYDEARVQLLRETNYLRIYHEPLYVPSVPRDTAIIMRHYILMNRIQDSSQAWSTLAGNVLTEFLATQSADGSYMVGGYGAELVNAPFMNHMFYFSAWMYYTYISADNAILTSAKKLCDWEMANMYYPATKALGYLSTSTTGSPDLNGLVLFTYSWYGYAMNDSTYTTYADDFMDGLQAYAYMWPHKAFNQGFRQSTPHLLWRNG